MDRPNRSLVRGWQLYFHVFRNWCDAFFWFLLHCEVMRCRQEASFFFLQHRSSHIAHSPVWVRICVPEPPSHSVRVGVVYGSPSVSLRMLCQQTAVEAQLAPLVDVDWVPLPDSRTRCEVALELIFGILVSGPTLFPEAHPGDQVSSALLVVVSSPFCVWIHRHCNLRGAVLVADLRIAQPDLLRPRRAQFIIIVRFIPDPVRSCPIRFHEAQYLLFLSVSNGVRPDSLTR